MNKLFVLISESYQEMVNKVTWPSLSSLQSSSVLVLIASLIFALFIGLIDFAEDMPIKCADDKQSHWRLDDETIYCIQFRAALEP